MADYLRTYGVYTHTEGVWYYIIIFYVKKNPYCLNFNNKKPSQINTLKSLLQTGFIKCIIFTVHHFLLILIISCMSPPLFSKEKHQFYF